MVPEYNYANCEEVQTIINYTRSLNYFIIFLKYIINSQNEAGQYVDKSHELFQKGRGTVPLSPASTVPPD
jgi:hypothetical protein